MIEFSLGVMVGLLLAMVIEWKLARAMSGEQVVEVDSPAPITPIVEAKNRTMWDREDPFVPKGK